MISKHGIVVINKNECSRNGQTIVDNVINTVGFQVIASAHTVVVYTNKSIELVKHRWYTNIWDMPPNELQNIMYHISLNEAI